MYSTPQSNLKIQCGACAYVCHTCAPHVQHTYFSQYVWYTQLYIHFYTLVCMECYALWRWHSYRLFGSGISTVHISVRICTLAKLPLSTYTVYTKHTVPFYYSQSILTTHMSTPKLKYNHKYNIHNAFTHSVFTHVHLRFMV